MFVLPTSIASNMGLIVAENKSLEQVRERGSHKKLFSFASMVYTVFSESVSG
jgi:hypothetical protein